MARMGDKLFLDTNILVYLSDEDAPEYIKNRFEFQSEKDMFVFFEDCINELSELKSMKNFTGYLIVSHLHYCNSQRKIYLMDLNNKIHGLIAPKNNFTKGILKMDIIIDPDATREGVLKLWHMKGYIMLKKRLLDSITQLEVN